MYICIMIFQIIVRESLPSYLPLLKQGS